MEEFAGVERHELTHRAMFIEKSEERGDSPKAKKLKTSHNLNT